MSEACGNCIGCQGEMACVAYPLAYEMSSADCQGELEGLRHQVRQLTSNCDCLRERATEAETTLVHVLVLIDRLSTEDEMGPCIDAIHRNVKAALADPTPPTGDEERRCPEALP